MSTDIHRITELTIGFICASVPSCNVLLGHIKSTYRRRRDASSVTVQEERHWGNSKHWWDNWVTSERWTTLPFSNGLRSGQ